MERSGILESVSLFPRRREWNEVTFPSPLLRSIVPSFHRYAHSLPHFTLYAYSLRLFATLAWRD